MSRNEGREECVTRRVRRWGIQGEGEGCSGDYWVVGGGRIAGGCARLDFGGSVERGRANGRVSRALQSGEGYHERKARSWR